VFGPAQSIVPDVQDAAWHVPLMQVCPTPQALPHVPQLLLLVLVLVSHPLTLFPSQLP
jgi:hypothetical protein